MELRMLEPLDPVGTATDALSFFREMAHLSRHAQEALTCGDLDSMLATLATRTRLIERSGFVLARFAQLHSELQPSRAAGSSPDGAGTDIEVLFEAVGRAAQALRDADESLVASLVAERNRIADEIAVVDHGEAVATTYRQSDMAPGNRLDLVR
jgi:hypothetical protein